MIYSTAVTLDGTTGEGPCRFTLGIFDETEEPTELGKLVPVGMTVIIFFFCCFHLFISCLRIFVTEHFFIQCAGDMSIYCANKHRNIPRI